MITTFMQKMTRLRLFIPYHQWTIMAFKNEPKDAIERLYDIIDTMPKRHETDKILIGDKIVYLHYFGEAKSDTNVISKYDLYVVEKDGGTYEKDIEGCKHLDETQYEAYGYIDIEAFGGRFGENGDWDVILINDLIKNKRFNIDLGWIPCKFSEIKYIN